MGAQWNGLDPAVGAVLSACGRYRYRLARPLALPGTRRCLFVMVNPSTADATHDDATIRKCRGFAAIWDCAVLEVVNLFAWRATDVRQLPGDVAAAVGPDNDAHIRAALETAAEVVVAWGSLNKLPRTHRGRAAHVLDLVRDAERTAWCLGRTKDGDPHHPLMLAYNTPREPFARPGGPTDAR